jgi:DNA-binding NtrC family response regulator
VEVLLLGSGAGTRALFTQVFEKSNWRLETVASVSTAVNKLRHNPMAVVIYEESNQSRPGTVPAWLELLSETRNLEHPPKVIVASRQADDRLWADVLHQGGYDVLPMPLESSEVLRTVSMAWLEWRRECEIVHPRAMAVGAGR